MSLFYVPSVTYEIELFSITLPFPNSVCVSVFVSFFFENQSLNITNQTTNQVPTSNYLAHFNSIFPSSVTLVCRCVLFSNSIFFVFRFILNLIDIDQLINIFRHSLMTFFWANIVQILSYYIISLNIYMCVCVWPLFVIFYVVAAAFVVVVVIFVSTFWTQLNQNDN